MLLALWSRIQCFSKCQLPRRSLYDRTWDFDPLVEILDVKGFRSTFLRYGWCSGGHGGRLDGLLFGMWWCSGHDGGR